MHEPLHTYLVQSTNTMVSVHKILQLTETLIPLIVNPMPCHW